MPRINTKDLFTLLQNTKGYIVNFSGIGKDADEFPSLYAYWRFDEASRVADAVDPASQHGWNVYCNGVAIDPVDGLLCNRVCLFVRDQMVEYNAAGDFQFRVIQFRVKITYVGMEDKVMSEVFMHMHSNQVPLFEQLEADLPSGAAYIADAKPMEWILAKTQDVFLHATSIRVDREVEDNVVHDIQRVSEIGQGEAYHLQSDANTEWTIPHQEARLHNTGLMDVKDVDGNLVRLILLKEVPFTPALLYVDTQREKEQLAEVESYAREVARRG